MKRLRAAARARLALAAGKASTDTKAGVAPGGQARQKKEALHAGALTVTQLASRVSTCFAMPLSPSALVARLATHLTLGDLLAAIVAGWGRYELIAHWQQGEFHHDTVLRIPRADLETPGSYLVLATNCNGGVKEVLCVAALPTRGGLWRWRCRDAVEFEGDAPTILARATTLHWFDPCQLLAPDARSEYREEHRLRQRGGGWTVKK